MAKLAKTFQNSDFLPKSNGRAAADFTELRAVTHFQYYGPFGLCRPWFNSIWPTVAIALDRQTFTGMLVEMVVPCRDNAEMVNLTVSGHFYGQRRMR